MHFIFLISGDNKDEDIVNESLAREFVRNFSAKLRKKELSQLGSQAIQSRKGAGPILRHLARFWVGADAFLPMMDIGLFYFIWNKELALKGVLLHEIYGPQNAEDLPVAFMFWVCLLIIPGIWVKSVCCLALCWHYGLSGNHQWLFKLEHCDLESFKIMDAQWSKTTYKFHWENFQGYEYTVTEFTGPGSQIILCVQQNQLSEWME